MDEDIGIDIIKRVRRDGSSRMTKNTNIDPVRGINIDRNRMLRNMKNRVGRKEHYNKISYMKGEIPEPTGFDIYPQNCFELACSAAELFLAQNIYACAGVIESGLYRDGPFHEPFHAFCVVGEPRKDDDLLKDVNGMLRNPLPYRWIVDPWLNICCVVEEYPNLARLKFIKYSNQEKNILKRGPDGDDKMVEYNPISVAFQARFFFGPLTFHEINQERLLMTKSARARV